MGFICSQRAKVILKCEARDCVIGLGLQIRRLYRATGGGAKLRHAAPIKQIGDQGCDKHGLARTTEPCDAQTDHRIRKGGLDRVCNCVDPARNTVCKRRDDHRPYPFINSCPQDRNAAAGSVGIDFAALPALCPCNATLCPEN